MSEVFRLVYTSQNRMSGSDSEIAAEIAEVLARSKRNNARAGVTGALMFNKGAFAQVLEGRRESVEETFERIQRDARHGDVTVLQCGIAPARTFANWSMAFVGLSKTASTLWKDMAHENGFDFSNFDGDDVFDVLHRILLEEEKDGPIVEERPMRTLDVERVRAELPEAFTRACAAPPSVTHSAAAVHPGIDAVAPELAVLRSALHDERVRTTELRGELDQARIAAAESLARIGQIQNERDLWTRRARLLAQALQDEADTATRVSWSAGASARDVA